MRYMTYLPIAALLCIVLASCGNPAEWSLQDQKGNTVKLSDFKGKPLVLHFWASWCPYCKKLQPGLDKLQQSYQSSDLVFLAINIKEDDSINPQQDLLSRGIQFKTLVKGDAIAKKYGVDALPQTLFFDRTGKEVLRTVKSDHTDPVFKSVFQEIIKK